MDVDVVALAVFVAIAAIIVLTTWTDYRQDVEKRQRLQKVHRHR